MAKTMAGLCHMYNMLYYNFLFNNDIDSIHILLNLYDLEENITNIRPKYITTREIKKKIKYTFNKRDDRDLIASNIINLIHDDIDRIELCLYLEGYKYGCYNNKWVNTLEEKSLYYFSVKEIYEKKFLFHFNTKYESISEIKSRFQLEMLSVEEKDHYINNLIYLFCENTIKYKITGLNEHLDRQLKIKFEDEIASEDDELFDEKSLRGLYIIIVKSLYENMIKTFIEAGWFGLNDKVLKRYS